jgi:hypothetical protein
MPNRNLKVKGLDKGSPTSESRVTRHSPFLKDCSLNLVGLLFGRHGRKAPNLVEKLSK